MLLFFVACWINFSCKGFFLSFHVFLVLVRTFLKAQLYFSCYRRLERHGGRRRVEGQRKPRSHCSRRPWLLLSARSWGYGAGLKMAVLNTKHLQPPHLFSSVSPRLQVETHLRMIPIVWSLQVLFCIFCRLHNLNPFPAGKEKDQNHLDLTLCSFRDRVKKPMRYYMCKEIMLSFLFCSLSFSQVFARLLPCTSLSWAHGLCQSKKGELLKVLGADWSRRKMRFVWQRGDLM